MARKRMANRQMMRFLTYAVIVFGSIFIILPIICMLARAFTPHFYMETIPPLILPDLHKVGLANLQFAWVQGKFSVYFWNNAFVAVTVCVGQTLLGAMIAYPLALANFPGKKALFAVVLTTMLIPGTTLFIPQYLLVRDLHWINTWQAQIVPMIAWGVPFNAFLLMSFFVSVPREIEESVMIDGGNRWTFFTRILLPISTAAISTAIIFGFLGAWDEFFWNLTIMSDEGKRLLNVAIYSFQSQFDTDLGVLNAALSLVVIPSLIVFIVFQKRFVKGVTAGAVKG